MENIVAVWGLYTFVSFYADAFLLATLLLAIFCAIGVTGLAFIVVLNVLIFFSVPWMKLLPFCLKCSSFLAVLFLLWLVDYDPITLLEFWTQAFTFCWTTDPLCPILFAPRLYELLLLFKKVGVFLPSEPSWEDSRLIFLQWILLWIWAKLFCTCFWSSINYLYCAFSSFISSSPSPSPQRLSFSSSFMGKISHTFV